MTRKMNRVLLAIAVIAAMAVSSMLVAVPTADAVTEGTIYGRSWDPNEDGIWIYGDSDYKNWACGLKDCANSKNLRGAAYATMYSWELPNYMQMNMETGFNGFGLEVSVSYGAGGAGGGITFVDNGSSCASGWVGNPIAYVSLTQWGEVCKASTWGAVTSVWTRTNTQYRNGWDWLGGHSYGSASLGGWW